MGRGRPKGSKNKKKKVTMECGSQTVESSLESCSGSKMSGSVGSSSPCSVMDEEEERVPPPAMFMGGVDANDMLSIRGRPRKDPPLLEPQVEPPPLQLCNKNKEVIILASDEDDDHSTIMFSDGEDPEEEPVKPAAAAPEIVLEAEPVQLPP